MAGDPLQNQRHEKKRQAKLEKKGVRSAARSEAADHELAMAEQAIAASTERRGIALAEIGGDADVEAEKHPLYLAAIARRDEALLDLQRTTVRAPAAGSLSHVRLQPVEHVEAGKAVLALVASADLRVEANLREVQLASIAIGQPAEIVVDAYPAVVWRAVVESIAPATDPSSRCCRRRMRPGTGSRSCSACRSGCGSSRRPMRPLLKS
jgi:membrane fusion protein (multidrug efflux system)